MSLIWAGLNPNFDQLQQELIDRFEKNIQAHHNKDVEFIIEDLGEEFFVMSQGDINQPSKEDQREQFTKYLNNTTFSEYTSLMEPKIEFSDDGSVAWGKYRVKVKGETIQEDGSKSSLDFVCAWLWIFRRQGDKWIRVGEVSTWR